MANPAAAETRAPKLRSATHTRPWMGREYVKVNGQELVYSISRAGGMTIHFPGRRSASADVLRSMGFTVVMPRVLRKEQAA
jgi:hypothetical protein